MRTEFPSDNPDLWRTRPPPAAVPILEPEAETVAVTETVAETVAVAENVAEPVAVSESVSVAVSESDDDVEVIEFDEADFAAVENESIPPAAPVDPFQLYVRKLVEVALAAGAAGRVVELLPAMLGLTRLDASALDAQTVDALIAADMLARSEGGAIVRSDSLVATAQAWRATLLGEEADFSACTTMLDEWSASLVATLAGAPAQKESYRRELRSRGVAAFGLVDAA